MPKEMLFLCDVYTKWLKDNNLPHQCASDILYGKDTMNRLTVNQTYWLENFISTWDIIAQNAQENIMTKIDLTDNELQELKYHYVDRIVGNMSLEDLLQYVKEDMENAVNDLSEVEFLDQAEDYWNDSFDDQKDIINDNLGVWDAEDEDDLIEEVTANAGWCIKSIDYEHQLK